MKTPESYAEFLTLSDAEKEELVKSMSSPNDPTQGDTPPSVPLQPVVRFLDGFIWLRIDALDNAVLRWRRLGKYRRWWEPRHAPLRLLHAALVYAWMPFYRRAKTDWQIHESNPSFQGTPHREEKT